MINTTTWGS